jgi:WD40 repeat protein
VTGVAFTPDGKRLATASKDMTLKLWDVALGRDILTLDAHDMPVSCVAFSADGHRLAAGVGDVAGKPAEIRIWDAEPITDGAARNREPAK